MPTPAELLAMVAVLVALGALLGGTALARRRTAIGDEAARKLVHVCMGLIACAFPWVFDRSLPVLVLCGLALAGLVGLRASRTLRRGLGAGLHDVGRQSYGELAYPLAIAAIWLLADRGADRVLYLGAMLVLALADAAAAVVGGRYGRLAYAAVGGRKSWEGSVAFFTVAFLAIHVPLLLGGGVGRLESLLIAGSIATVVTMAEAIAWRGLDNIILPLLVALLIWRYRELDAPALGERLAVALTLLGIAWWSRGRSRLDAAAAFGGALFAYTAYGFHHLGWLLAPLALLVVHPLALPRSQRLVRTTLGTLLAVAGPPALVAVIGAVRADPACAWAFHATWATALAAIVVVRYAAAWPRLPLWLLVPGCALGASGAMTPPLAAVLFIEPAGEAPAAAALRAGLGVLAGTALVAAAIPRVREAPMHRLRWLIQGLVSAGVGVAVCLA